MILRPGATQHPRPGPLSFYSAPAPRLRPWSRIWRYLAASLTGLILVLFVSADYLGTSPESISPEAAGAIGGLLLLDLLLGAMALCVLPLRRRRPFLTAVVTASFTAISASSLGAAALATVSMSTRRRWRHVVVVGMVWAACTVFYETVLRPSVPGVEVRQALGWASGGVALMVYAVCVATGFYIGARRALLASLRDRAENAEREQALKAESAREAERTRIAREMHDVLAHRISLVALHAGALSFRTDLTREETAQAAGIIQDNAHLALTELRQVLGVLRGGPTAGGTPEPAQPTLDELPALFADTGEAGTHVRLDAAGLLRSGEPSSSVGARPDADSPLAGLSKTVSRTAYRIIQEALTNARKHAPGEPVRLRLDKTGELLQIEVRNSVGSALAGGTPGGGVGLIGLRERAGLAGGMLEHGTEPDGSFVLRAWLPWV